MSKRFQVGQVFVRNGRFIGRYRTDVLEGRKRKAVVLGLRGKMTKQDARRELLDVIHGEACQYRRSPRTFASSRRDVQQDC